MKLSQNLQNLRDHISTLEATDPKGADPKSVIHLYLLVGPKKGVRLVKTAPGMIDLVRGDMHPGSSIWSMAGLGVMLPIDRKQSKNKGSLGIVIPLSDVPAIIAQLSDVFNRALVLASVVAKEKVESEK